jgi:hypothetical protein
MYPLCLTREDRIDLAAEEGVESLAKLYNLGSRLDATRGHSINADEFYFDPERLSLRDKPDKIWQAKEDRYIKTAWRHLHIEKIAYRLRCSETAVAHRARQLGLRGVCYYWDAKKVVRWLGIDGRTLIELSKPRQHPKTQKPAHTLELYPCRDRHGVHKIMLVSATSLARIFAQDSFWKKLVDKRNADQFFIKEVMEGAAAAQLTQELMEFRRRLERDDSLSEEDLVCLDALEEKVAALGGETYFESNAWVSHGHTSLNPYSESCFGLFFDGDDKKMAGCNLNPWDLVEISERMMLV